jgi:regulator of PEP synthase PpsR (kinase-PPPase family)
VIELAAEAGAFVVFTAVNKGVARTLRERADAQGVVLVDLLGPLIAKVAEHLSAEPRHEPGLLHGFSDDYFRRIEAVEFAVRHDDGANPHTLFQADIVLTGVSRTSKTPLTMYLAQRGYKTGNVPLVPELETPRALLELDPRKVFGLVLDPDTLLTVRQARVRALGAAPHRSYVDPEVVQEELERARRLFRERGWRTVNISGKAVEENAARILALYQGS